MTTIFNETSLLSYKYNSVLENLGNPVPKNTNVLRIKAASAFKNLLKTYFNEEHSSALVSTNICQEILTLRTKDKTLVFKILVKYDDSNQIIYVHTTKDEKDQAINKLRKVLEKIKKP